MIKKVDYLVCLLFLALAVGFSNAGLVAEYYLEDGFEKTSDVVINEIAGESGAWGNAVIEDRNAAGTDLTYAISVDGLVNKGLHFTDISSVILSNHIAIDTGSQFVDGDNFTVMGWSKTPVATTTWRSMMFGQYSSTGATGGNMYLSPCDKVNGFKARLYLGSNCPALMSADAYNDDQWHHVAATYDGSTAKLYVDGVEVASESFSGIIFNSDSNLAIGNLSNLNAQKMPTTGTYDELRVYDNALSAAEIATVYNQSSYVGIEETEDETRIAEAVITDSIIISLTQEPLEDVYFTADPNSVDVGNGAGLPITLTFTASDWNVPQTITVTSVDDAIDNGVKSDIIVNTVSSSDPDYDGIHLNDTIVTVFDDDGSCGDWGMLAGDVSGDCYVGLADLNMMVSDWLSCTEPSGVSCVYEF